MRDTQSAGRLSGEQGRRNAKQRTVSRSWRLRSVRKAAPPQWKEGAGPLTPLSQCHPPSVTPLSFLHTPAGQLLWHCHILPHLTEGPVGMLTPNNLKGPTYLHYIYVVALVVTSIILRHKNCIFLSTCCVKHWGFNSQQEWMAPDNTGWRLAQKTNKQYQ